MNSITGTGLAFPLGVNQRGAIALVDGETGVEQAIRIILGTAPGERMMRPEFGCTANEFVFDTIEASTLGRIETALRTALARWEPRIAITGIHFDTNEADTGVLMVTIGYTIQATNQPRNLVYPFYIIPAEETQ